MKWRVIVWPIAQPVTLFVRFFPTLPHILPTKSVTIILTGRKTPWRKHYSFISYTWKNNVRFFHHSWRKYLAISYSVFCRFYSFEKWMTLFSLFDWMEENIASDFQLWCPASFLRSDPFFILSPTFFPHSFFLVLMFNHVSWRDGESNVSHFRFFLFYCAIVLFLSFLVKKTDVCRGIL